MTSEMARHTDELIQYIEDKKIELGILATRRNQTLREWLADIRNLTFVELAKAQRMLTQEQLDDWYAEVERRTGSCGFTDNWIVHVICDDVTYLHIETGVVHTWSYATGWWPDTPKPANWHQEGF